MSRSSRRPRIALLCTLLSVASSTAIAGQEIRGRLLDDATGEAVVVGSVVLIHRDEGVAHGVLTDSAGAFTLRAPGEGRYQIRAGRLGYEEVTSNPLDIRRGEVVEVELRLSTRAIPLAPLTVISERPPLVFDSRLVRRGYYERRLLYGEKMGFGRFLDQDEIDRRGVSRMSSLLGQIPGLQLSSEGGRRVAVAGRRGCEPSVYLDGIRFRLFGIPIDEVVSLSSVAAVEVYPGAVKPMEFMGLGRRPSCATIVIWTGPLR